MSDIYDSEVFAQAKNFIIEEFLERSPEYLDISEYLDDNWIEDEDVPELSQDVIDDVYKQVVRQLGVLSRLYEGYED